MEILKITDGNKLFKYTPRYNIINLQKQLFDATKHTQYYFSKCELESVDGLIEYSDTENVTDMSYMFYYCENLQTIPELNTSNVTDMSYMFYNCPKLQTIPQLDTSKITDMSSMFSYCFDLQTIPQLDTSKVTDMSSMFDKCTNLKTIDITSMDKITSTSNSASMCYNCDSLTKLIIRNMTVIPPLNSSSLTNCCHFNGTINSNYNPEGLKDGRIYVPDNMVDSLKSATNWSAYADIIVPLSSLEE